MITEAQSNKPKWGSWKVILGVSEQTFHSWRNQYGGMKANQMKRLKELERENARLKKVVADQALDKQILKEALEISKNL